MVKKKRFLGGKKWPKNGPKMAKKVMGVPQKIPKKSKMAKTGPTEPRVIALKRVKMH